MDESTPDPDSELVALLTGHQSALRLYATYDAGARTTTHYLNGEAISEERLPDALVPEKIRIGAASIGNWSDPRYRTEPGFVVRNLNGAIDEFAIFGAALTAEEIQELYHIGRP